MQIQEHNVTRIILLNGPRQVGKNFIADRYLENASNARTLPVMWPGKLAAMAEYGVPPSVVEAMEFTKDAPHDMLCDLVGRKTPREVYIDYGERMRAEEGEAYFANAWVVHAAQLRHYDYILVPDVRFQLEVDAASREFGQHNVLLVRVRRQDYDWRLDIGSYCDHCCAADFDNDVDASVDCPGLRLHETVRDLMP